MKYSELPSSFEHVLLPFEVPENAFIIIPMQSRTKMLQIHYLLDLNNSKGLRIEIGLDGHLSHLDKYQDRDSKGFPLNFANNTLWKTFCIGPHSLAFLGENRFQIGLRCFNRFIELDVAGKTAKMQDPEINDDFLSCTNWINPINGNCWFASWDIEDTVRRIQKPTTPVRVKIWELSVKNNVLDQKWDDSFGDFLHQLNVSSDGRYLVLCEMGMRPSMSVPVGHPGNHPYEWRQFQLDGIIPSEILVLDLNKGNAWRIKPTVGTPAHIEFDPEDHSLCYISCHNVALVNGTNMLFGPGVLYCYRLGDNGPQQEGKFTSPDFFRTTTHCLFKHRDHILIGVTGFPDKIFLIDARTMKLFKRLQIFEGQIVNTDSEPRVCKQDPRSPYSLAPSIDGEMIYIIGSGSFFTVSIETGLFQHSPWSFSKYPGEEIIAGHITKISLHLDL